MKLTKMLSAILALSLFLSMISVQAYGYNQDEYAWKNQTIMVIEVGKFENANEENDYFRIQLGLDSPDTIYTGSGFFGGDLQGVKNKVPHLKDLGISTAMLYPVMQSDKNPFMTNLTTGYNITDWTKIDPNFNTPGKSPDDFSDYIEMIQEFHDLSNGGYRINVMQDMAFAMSGFEHPWFKPFYSENYIDYFKRWDPVIASNNISVDGSYQTFDYKASLDISPYFNADVFSFDSNRSDATVTGSVYSLPAEKVGISSYGYIGSDTMGFEYGIKLDGHNNAILGSATENTVMDIPASKCAVLGVLAFTPSDVNQNVTFRIEYEDASFTDTNMPIYSWNNTMFSTAYLDHRHSPAGDVAAPIGLYTYLPTIDPTKKATKIILLSGEGAANTYILSASAMPVTPAVKVDLADYYNEDGLSSAANFGDTSGPIAATGNIFPVIQYAGNTISQYFTGEYGQEHIRTSFVVGPMTDGRNNMVYCNGQQVDVHNTRYHEFRIAAFASYGATQSDQTFRVNYTDGSHTDTNLTIKAMNAAPESGDVAVHESSQTHINFGSWFPAESFSRIWGYKLNVDWTKTVASISLPMNQNIHLVAVTPIVKLDHGWALPVIDHTYGMPEGAETGSGMFEYSWENIIKFWMDKGLDGLRIDSVQNFDIGYLQKILNDPGFFKDLYPNGVMFGEAAVTSNPLPWQLHREQYTNHANDVGFHALYDWETTDGIRKTFAMDVSAKNGSTSLINESIAWDAKYDEPWNQVAFFNVYENYPFLDNIDDVLYPTYEDKLPKIKMAAAYLFTINRVPMLFSGNEYLLEYGETAPRGSNASKAGYMFTDEVQNNPVYQDNYEFMKNLIAVRKENPALTSAEKMTSEKWIKQEDHLFGFIRQEEGSTPIIAMFNNSPNVISSFNTEIPENVTGQSNYNFILKDDQGNYGTEDPTVSWLNANTLNISSMQPWEVKIIRISGNDGDGGGDQHGGSSPAPGPSTPGTEPSGTVVAIPVPFPDITVTKQGNTGFISTSVNAVVDSALSKALVSVEDRLVQYLIEKLQSVSDEQDNTKHILELSMALSGTVKTVEFEMPVSAMKLISQVGNTEVKLNTSIASITFDRQAVLSINNTASSGSIRIRIQEIDKEILDENVRVKIGDHPVYDFSVEIEDTNMSSFGNGYANVSIPYTLKTGEKKNAIVVYYIDHSGNLKNVRVKYNEKNETVDFKTPHFSHFAVGYNEVSFTDVTEEAWYQESVEFLSARNIIKEVGEGRYAPEQHITRADFLMMLMNAFGIEADEDITSNFEDAGNKYYTTYLGTAKRLGLVNGTGGNRFMPEQSIKRQDLFVMLYRILNKLGELPQTSVNIKILEYFRDYENVSEYAKAALQVLVESGIVAGDGVNLLPNSNSTRAQAAKVLHTILTME